MSGHKQLGRHKAANSDIGIEWPVPRWSLVCRQPRDEPDVTAQQYSRGNSGYGGKVFYDAAGGHLTLTANAKPKIGPNVGASRCPMSAVRNANNEWRADFSHHLASEEAHHCSNSAKETSPTFRRGERETRGGVEEGPVFKAAPETK